jgi:signal transduction histidine kinase
MLQMASPDLSELKDIVSDIVRDEQRAYEVIKRLRSLLAKTPAEAEEVDLNAVVREVFEFLSAQAAARGVTLSTNLAAHSLYVRGDRIQLQQVILNLVINGMDAMGSRTSRERNITARTALLDGGSVEVAIEDSGSGLPANKAEQIFEPFFTTKDAGMGMGLAVARTIITSHGGRIWAEDRRGGGAVLRFTLPFAKTTPSSVPAAVSQRETPAAG